MTAHITTPKERARYREAAAFVLNFGKHQGKTLDAIGTVDIPYLVWLRTSMAKGVPKGDKGPVSYEMLCWYLDDPAIAEAVAQMPVGRR